MKTREKIRHEALRLFNEKGLNQVGVREIARALSISSGNLSYHFPRKEDIIIELMDQIGVENDRIYEGYFSGPPSLERFLITIRQIFQNQYEHRGVFIGRDEINKIVKAHYDYRSIEVKRLALFRTVFEGLSEAGELDLEESDISFLVSFISLFGRFWMMEAFISYSDWSKKETIDHYLGILAKQLSLFANEK